jgi:uncharacterized protein (TIGR02466 family)
MSTLFVNKQAKIEQWFPKAIYLLDDFYSDGRKDMNQWLNEMFLFNGDFKRTPELNVNSTHTQLDLSQEDFFSSFIGLLTEEVAKFSVALGYNLQNQKLKLENMWSNLSVRGDYLFPHNHPSSFISGAYYVDCGDRDVIKFYDNPQNMISPSPSPNQFSFEDVSYSCMPGRLIMFKSDFMHGCPALIGERKIVISFNFGLHNVDRV